MQRRAYEEVKEVAERHNGKINHETIGEMDYLEAVIMENLRIHPPGTLQIRLCKEDCEVLGILSEYLVKSLLTLVTLHRLRQAC